MTDVQAPTLGCPFAHHAKTAGPQRSHADEVVRRVLRVSDRPTGAPSRSAVYAFRRSMVISTVRCTLTYLVFPFVLPALGLVTNTGVLIGLVIGLLAIACDVFTIRRFFSVDHKWRWHFSTVAVCVIALLSVLLVQDVIHLAS